MRLQSSAKQRILNFQLVYNGVRNLCCYLFQFAIWQGLHLAWSHGHRRVIIETDATEAVHAIQQSNRAHPNFNLYQEVHKLLSQDWQCDLRQTWREANMCVDFVTKNALTLQGMHTVMLNAPPWLTAVLMNDKQGVCSSRVTRF
ncbi:hypothetical protein LOK49_Contig20G00015 [Camellia lanceoleosa]|nr:hypothetical protein LOK49_Contig20G00015 [Camellia lanceoleosa]